MKLPFLFILLLVFSVSCKKNVEPQEPDAATIVAGNYKLTKAVLNGRDAIDLYKETTLTVTKINASSVKADYELKGVSSWNETWTLSVGTKDTITINKGGPDQRQYEQGKVTWNNIGVGIFLWFEQVK